MFKAIKQFFRSFFIPEYRTTDHAPQFKKTIKRQAVSNKHLRMAIIQAEKHGNMHREKMLKRKGQYSPNSRRGCHESERNIVASM